MTTTRFTLAFLLVLTSSAAPMPAQEQQDPTTDQAKQEPMQSLPRSTPEEQGVRSSGIAAFVEATDQKVDSMHSFMLLRHGKVIAETWWAPHAPDQAHVLWSLSKSFTGTAIGLAIAEGKLSLDDRVMDFFPDQLPEEPSWGLRAMRVRDLLTMNTGHQDEVNLRGSKDWVKDFLAHPVPHKPGTHFRYNTPASFMLSAIIQEVTGESTLDYLTPRLFTPLGIEKPRWGATPKGISLGGFGLFLRTEDIAKFGQLYLQKGQWQGEQIIPADWVQQASSKQVSTGSDPEGDWDQGYGFQFWRCRFDAYRGDGKDGQYCIVLPKLDAVVVVTANARDMSKILTEVWIHLVPTMEKESLKANPEAGLRLQEAMTGLEATR